MTAGPYRSEKVAHMLRAIDAAILREIEAEGDRAGGSEEQPIWNVSAMFNPDEHSGAYIDKASELLVIALARRLVEQVPQQPLHVRVLRQA